MKCEITVPVTDVNSESAVIVWSVEDRSHVGAGEQIGSAETSKAVIDLEAPTEGYLCRTVPDGAEVDLDTVIAWIFEDRASLEEHLLGEASDSPSSAAASSAAPAVGVSGVRATRSAAELAARHGIDLTSLDRGELLTTSDVETALGARTTPVDDLPDPLPGDGRRRLLLIGAGLGATQVLDILGHDEAQSAVAIVDDERVRWGDEVESVPVVGGRERIEELLRAGAIDAAVVTISTSVEVRAAMRAWCERLALPLANVVDPTARIATGVELGQGNVICAFSHLGVGAVLGHNNFLSAYNSFDHHSVLGSDISTGPGCMTSGLVTLGDRVRLGTGIFVEPKVRIGSGAVVASGSTVLVDVPDEHVVRARAGATVVSPLRR